MIIVTFCYDDTRCHYYVFANDGDTRLGGALLRAGDAAVIKDVRDTSMIYGHAEFLGKGGMIFRNLTPRDEQQGKHYKKVYIDLPDTAIISVANFGAS